MKKSFSILSLVAFPFLSCAQQGNYVVQGQLAIQKIPEWAYLLSDNPTEAIADSVEIRDGSFIFSGVLNSPVKANLFTGRNLKQAQSGFCLTFYLEPDTVFMSSPDTLRHMDVKGGRENACFQDLMRQLEPVYAQLKALGHAYMDATKPYMASLDDMEKIVARFNNQQRKNFNDIEARHWQITKQFVKNHPDSVVSLDAIYLSAHNNLQAEDVPSVEGLLSTRVKNNVPLGANKKKLKNICKFKRLSIILLPVTVINKKSWDILFLIIIGFLRNSCLND